MSLFMGHPHTFMGTQAHHRRVRAPTREKFADSTMESVSSGTANHAGKSPPGHHLQLLAALEFLAITHQMYPTLAQSPTEWDPGVIHAKIVNTPGSLDVAADVRYRL